MKSGGYTKIIWPHETKAHVKELTATSHYVLIIVPPGSNPSGLGILPLSVDTKSTIDTPKILRQYNVRPRDIKSFMRLLLADKAAADAGLYKPAPPARWVQLRATRRLPLPKDITL